MSGSDTHNVLSDRELQIVELVAAGLTNQDIAKQLEISKRTVDNHISNILQKTNTDNRVSLVRWALQWGKVCLDEVNCCTLPPPKPVADAQRASATQGSATQGAADQGLEVAAIALDQSPTPPALALNLDGLAEAARATPPTTEEQPSDEKHSSERPEPIPYPSIAVLSSRLPTPPATPPKPIPAKSFQANASNSIASDAQAS